LNLGEETAWNQTKDSISESVQDVNI
jgi:hypothetical protein